ncbi:geranylgeranyl pyrophosphate synthetase [Penicillium frequentans]|uniref:Geranylgeranyl pyrophosphate synthetase n=1 Tax=Penicillium frequentans TaxID=3151616 RepID=A0AAD6G9Y6_9EURO|nr:geranylgeranyl pyrophosphate synthetase [Penicillium glabrum]
MSGPKKASDDLVEISRLGLESSAPAEAAITDVEHLASYNWIEASTPTIAVPGSPAYWSAPQGSRSVKKDSGLVYIAQNAARHPDSPLEPLFRSLYIEQPSFDINSIDIFEQTEIKTRVRHKSVELSEVAPQLWASQTPKLIRAYHQRGIFSMPKVEDVDAALKNWEKTHQKDITKLVALINRILQVTRNWGGGSTIQYDAVKDKLVVKKTEKKKMLPDDLYRRWADVVPAKVSQKISKHKVKSSSDTKAVRT